MTMLAERRPGRRRRFAAPTSARTSTRRTDGGRIRRRRRIATDAPAAERDRVAACATELAGRRRRSSDAEAHYADVYEAVNDRLACTWLISEPGAL